MLIDLVTVVLPTRNEAAQIGRFLAALPPAVPLIVVDSSSDATPDLIAQLRSHNTQVIRQMVNIPQARQLGAEQAQTEWLLFTDVDVQFAADYWDVLAHYLTDGRARGVLYGPKLSADAAFRTYYRATAVGQAVLDRCGIPAASGSNLLIRRDALLDAGGFDPQLVCNEDSEIAWRVQRRGYATQFAPDLIVHAFDHRRLRRGRLRKTVHSLTRCALLYTNLMPARWRSHDWGYWRT